MKKVVILLAGLIVGTPTINAQNMNTNKTLAVVEPLQLTQEWDKTFPKSEQVNHRKVTFVNRYGITLAADLYTPKNPAAPKLAAIAVSGPHGAVKEQAAGLYAQRLAEMGFMALAFDPSFTGESGGFPRRLASVEICTEDFSAAVDFLSVQEEVNQEAIGILGICGWGGFGIQAAANDPRIKATVAVTMYNICRVRANGYFDADDHSDKRYEQLKRLAEQRTQDYRQGFYERAGGVIDPLPDEAPQFVKEYYAYYKTPRGYHARSGNSTDGWTLTSSLPFINFPLLNRASEIRHAVMVVHGEKAHSRYMGEEAFALLNGENKKLLIVPNAHHTDLYDNLEKIPFDDIRDFYHQYLK